MGTAAWGKFPALIQDLLENAPGYEFFQAVRLVEICSEGSAGRPGSATGAVRFRPAPEISFPAGDIRRCSLDDRGRLDFELNFMGLYGVDGPLPHFFIEQVASADEPGQVLRAFLDIFNHRLYQLLYLAWKKFRQPTTGDGEASLYERYLGALRGIPAAGAPAEDLAFAGLLGSRVKNSEGLAGILAEFLQMPVRIRQQVPCWVRLDGVPPLGADGEGLRLGENCLLGDRVLDVSRKLEVILGPVPMAAAWELLPGRERAGELGRLIRRYLDPTLDFDLVLQIRAEPGPAARLGGQEVILGWTACLGEMGEATNSIHLPGSSFEATRDGAGGQEVDGLFRQVA